MTPNIDIFLYNRQNIQEKVEEALSKSLSAGCHDEKDYNNIFQSFAKLSKSFPLNKKSKFWSEQAGQYLDEAIKRYPEKTLLNESGYMVH